jgi:hypothetical protein
VRDNLLNLLNDRINQFYSPRSGEVLDRLCIKYGMYSQECIHSCHLLPHAARSAGNTISYSTVVT